jgi:hypothetical protein
MTVELTEGEGQNLDYRVGKDEKLIHMYIHMKNNYHKT